MDIIRFGVWVWGSATVVIAIAVFGIVVVAAIHINPTGGFAPAAPPWLPKVYKVLQDLGTLIGAAIGFSALAWAYFFQAMMSE